MERPETDEINETPSLVTQASASFDHNTSFIDQQITAPLANLDLEATPARTQEPRESIFNTPSTETHGINAPPDQEQTNIPPVPQTAEQLQNIANVCISTDVILKYLGRDLRPFDSETALIIRDLHVPSGPAPKNCPKSRSAKSPGGIPLVCDGDDHYCTLSIRNKLYIKMNGEREVILKVNVIQDDQFENSGIYFLWYEPVSRYKYIGQAKNIHKRLQEHLVLLQEDKANEKDDGQTGSEKKKEDDSQIGSAKKKKYRSSIDEKLNDDIKTNIRDHPNEWRLRLLMIEDLKKELDNPKLAKLVDEHQDSILTIMESCAIMYLDTRNNGLNIKG